MVSTRFPVQTGKRVSISAMQMVIGCVQGVQQQDGDCHGTDSTRDWRNPAGSFFRNLEFNIARQFSVRKTINTNIHNDRAWPNPGAFHQIWLADSDDQDIGS